MGAVTSSEFSSLPVEGLCKDSALSVIPLYRTSLLATYTVNRHTLLKLKTASIWSVDSNILDARGFFVFGKSGSILARTLEFADDMGNTLAAFEKPTWDRKALVTLGGSLSNDCPVAATIIHKFRGSCSCSRADIFLHHPPTLVDDLESVDREPDIHVLGDLDKYTYDFMLGPLHNDPIKIAQVTKSPEHKTFCLNIGPYVDIAFMTICASALDLLQVRCRTSPFDNITSCIRNCSKCSKDGIC